MSKPTLLGTEKISIRDWPRVAALLNSLPHPPQNQLYYGRPGTGKSTYICGLSPDYERITLSQSQFPDALLGKFLLRNGSTEWVDAYASRAARRGVPLLLEEIHKAGGELDSTFNSIMDDLGICKINLDNGEVITPAEGYRVLATMNGNPDTLPETVLDRFDVVIRCDTPHDGILRRLSPESAAYLMNKIQNEPETDPYIPDHDTRAFLSFENLRKQGVSDELAAEIIFGEGQGKTVLMGMIDAVRNNGRLP
jgi:MoxR-like ATPase